MQYLTGVHALNIDCGLDTCGDWHQSALKWQNLTIRDASESVFGTWGIEEEKAIPNNTENFAVANHIRALLDLIAEGNFAAAQGMKDDFICNDDYTQTIFEKVLLLKGSSLWKDIDAFMAKEYRMQWIKFMKGVNNGSVAT